MPSTTNRPAYGASRSYRTGAAGWVPTAATVSAAWASIGSHSLSRGAPPSRGATAERRRAASSGRPNCAATRASETRGHSIGDCSSMVASARTRASPSRSSVSVYRHQRWVTASIWALALPALRPSSSTSSRAAAQSS
ncbi:hypothetical protein ACQEWB_33245 [Streptomyces sp. CA-249302]|uniref:hypothetical protein n=1 Tax=Streptomyces sp. CA-249302 TaxID=3240058 RepID=UPI003D933D00